MATTDLKTLAEIAKTVDVNSLDYEFIGLRVVNDECDGFNFVPGDDAPNSYVWDDGEWTNDELNGSCCISIKYLLRKSSFWPVAYFGSKVWLVGGDYAEYGADDGELIIKDAKILAVFDISK